MPLIETPALWLPSYSSGYAASQADAASPGLWDGLVGLWQPTLGVTGETLRDVSGRHNHGTPQNMTASNWVMSEHGWALDFNGTTQNILLPSMSFTNEMTFSGWAYRTNTATNDVMIGGTSANHMAIRSDNGSEDVRFWANVTDTVAVWDDAFPTAQWVHWALIYKSTPTAELFINGASQGVEASAAWGNAADTVRIGARSASSDDWLGQQFSVAMHNRALTPNEIQQLYVDPHALVRPMQRLFVGGGAAAADDTSSSSSSLTSSSSSVTSSSSSSSVTSSSSSVTSSSSSVTSSSSSVTSSSSSSVTSSSSSSLTSSSSSSLTSSSSSITSSSSSVTSSSSSVTSSSSSVTSSSSSLTSSSSSLTSSSSSVTSSSSSSSLTSSSSSVTSSSSSVTSSSSSSVTSSSSSSLTSSSSSSVTSSSSSSLTSSSSSSLTSSSSSSLTSSSSSITSSSSSSTGITAVPNGLMLVGMGV